MPVVLVLLLAPNTLVGAAGCDGVPKTDAPVLLLLAAAELDPPRLSPKPPVKGLLVAAALLLAPKGLPNVVPNVLLPPPAAALLAPPNTLALLAAAGALLLADVAPNTDRKSVV